jgi:hypothetical protein
MPLRLVAIRNTNHFFIGGFLFVSTRLTMSDAQVKYPQKQTSELRERQLREKIKKMRQSSFESVATHANAH